MPFSSPPAALVSIVTGAAFTTNEERPFYSFGQSHLMVGIVAGVLTIGLVIWLLQTEKRAVDAAARLDRIGYRDCLRACWGSLPCPSRRR